MRVDLFDYHLPADRIAQEPRQRGTSRLLVLDRLTGAISHRSFGDLPGLLRPGDLVVRNDVRVRPVRLFGKDKENRWVEIFLLRAHDEGRAWTALAKPGRRARQGQILRFEEDLEGRIESVEKNGERTIRFGRTVDDALLSRIGRTPLPPYIRRPAGAPDRDSDSEAYQTVFAREPRAVAAPTAGLHFTKEILEEIRARGVEIADLTLAIGAGTFKPVTVVDTQEHGMDAEEVLLPAATLARIAETKRSGGRVLAVGTTVTRALEAAALRPEGLDASGDQHFFTNLFISPGFQFGVVDALLTNFHLPCSTLLMLVCAFGGRERILTVYGEAVAQGYLFYSYGDAMLVA